MGLWYIGNTTVRSALRLRDGLVALANSPLQGNIRGQKGDMAFRQLLGQHGIVSLGDDPTNSVGRKWRSALGKLGFLYPEIPKSSGIKQGDVGRMDTITPNGQRLIQSEVVPAMQECFLRAMAAQFIESKDAIGESTWFSPLRHTLALLLELEKKTGQGAVNFIEMALYVQTTGNADDLSDIAEKILAFRNERKIAQSKRLFDAAQYDAASAEAHLKARTFRDYADANMRYLKATGLVQNRGRGITLAPEKHLLAELIANETTVPSSKQEYWQNLCEGAKLPTDTLEISLDILNDSIAQLQLLGISFSIGKRPVDSVANVTIIRFEIDDIVSKRKEESFAQDQAVQWKEIADYLDLIASRKYRKSNDSETRIVIPKTDVPAYFEWVLWRAFLAIDHLANKPYQARRFRIDSDILPLGPAPGNGPDLIMEFQDYVVVIEVTLTESSRQEATEGEPVRRHVADLMKKYSSENGKPVYGLFVANHIDSNTAETFRTGVWYSRDDKRLDLKIIPITTAQFCEFFTSLFETNNANPQSVFQFMCKCDQLRSQCDGPEWKKRIANVVQQTVQSFNS